MSDFVRIAQVVCSGSQSTITFSSIPGTYTNLKLLVSGRDTGSVTAVSIFMKFNADATAANYVNAQFGNFNAGTASAGTVSSTTSGANIGAWVGVSGNANAIAVIEVTIYDYAGTTFFKDFSASSGGIYSGSVINCQTSQWKSTAAITSITITAPSTAFVDGSKATLYGIA